MPFLNLDLDYFTSPKTVRLSGLLGVGSETLPLRLWCHVAKHHARDGVLAGYSAQEVESFVGWRGDPGKAVEAMLRVGFLEETNGGFVVHDWLEHQGHIWALKKRNKRVAKVRWKNIREKSQNGEENSDSSSIPVVYQKSNPGVPLSFPSTPSIPTITTELAPSPPGSVLVLDFPVVGSKVMIWAITDEKIRQYSETYPHIDVMAELKKARQWLIDNPPRRKTARGMPKFLNGWLARGQDSGRGARIASATTDTDGDSLRLSTKKFLAEMSDA